TETEQPIIGDWGFYNVGNQLPSPWRNTSTNGRSVIYCDDDMCGQIYKPLEGFFYAYFEGSTVGSITLEQDFDVRPFTNNMSMFLDFSCSSNSFQIKSSSVSFRVSINDINVMVLSNTLNIIDYHIDISYYLNFSSPTNKIKFTSTRSVNDFGDFDYSSPRSLGNDDFQGFFLSGVTVLPNYPSYISSDIYVDLVKGSDRNGDGSANSPFSSLSMALYRIMPTYNIFLADGVYCGFTFWYSITKSVSIIGTSRDGTIINGQDRLQAFHVAGGIIQVNIANVTITNAYSSAMVNGGAALLLEGSVSTVVMSNVLVINSRDYANKGVVTASGNVDLYLNDCTITNCSQSVTSSFGPAVNVLSFNALTVPARLHITDTTLTRNEFALYVDRATSVSITGSLFDGGQSSNNDGECVTSLSSVTDVYITTSSFLNHRNGALCITHSQAWISDSVFNNNTNYLGEFGIMYITQSSTVDIDNVNITNVQDLQGIGLFITESSIVTIRNSIISDLNSKLLDASLIQSSESTLTINNTQIFNVQMLMIVSTFLGELTILDSEVRDTTGSVVYSSQTYVYLADSIFYNNFNSPSYTFLLSSSNSVITGSRFESQRGTMLIRFNDVYIINSTITNNTQTFVVVSSDSTLFLHGSTISNNYNTMIDTEQGGQVNINNSTIIDNLDNTAYSGGVISMTSSGIVALRGSTFESNQAEDGGAIIIVFGPTYVSQMITIVECIFTNNTAPYGLIMASNPVKLQFDESQFPLVIISNVTTFTGYVTVIDLFNQTVPISVSLNKLVYLRLNEVTISMMPVVNGYANFTNVQLIGKVNNTASITFLCNDRSIIPVEMAAFAHHHGLLPGPTTYRLRDTVQPMPARLIRIQWPDMLAMSRQLILRRWNAGRCSTRLLVRRE
ncbi:hypothetical protein SAMD00019534_085500, partial [Acytostelium subglobosum LB1]|uniref:hypothetical protein n=1 Tax=Acytostelium subglobosum LB1 TaxID=1410327 RepID=UPI000644BF0B